MWNLLIVLVFGTSSHSQIITDTFVEKEYQIAGIFESKNNTNALAFNESVSHTKAFQRQLVATLIVPIQVNSLHTWKELCKYKSINPLVVFGPQDPISDGAVREQCAVAQIPHLQATWKPYDPDRVLTTEEDEEVTEEAEKTENEEKPNENVVEESAKEEAVPVFKKITINFYPEPDEIAVAYGKVITYYQWDTFAAVYEDDMGLMRIQKILSETTDDYPVIIRRLDPNNSYRNQDVFKELKNYQMRRILMDCDVNNTIQYMMAANQSTMTKPYQHYLMTSMDTAMVADKLKVFESNFTWLSLADVEALQDAQHFLAPRVAQWSSEGGPSPPVTNFQLEALLMDDVTNHVLEATRVVESAHEDFTQPIGSPCDSEEPWAWGPYLQDAILKTQRIGVSGNVQFDEYGRRINYTLFVNEIYLSYHDTIGRWESGNGDEIILNAESPNKPKIGPQNKEFIIISRLADPYFAIKEECKTRECSDQERYEGFSVDLVEHIFEELKRDNLTYRYKFVYSQDNGKEKSYGKFNNETKKWNGLIGDLLNGDADFAVCDLTITEERKEVVDFSVPFMSLGISILYTKETKMPPAMFSFLNPYSFEVWMYTATAYCIVSIVLFICARISPADWENPQPCEKDPEELENIWNFKNCAWLTMGSIMTQGCDILPKAFGTRWVCGMWWFFAVIVCQTYIAQLSASMTSAMGMTPIHSVEDLASQSKVLYGAIAGGSTLDFFKNSNDKIYKTIAATMDKYPSLLVNSNNEGEKRVLSSRNKYAFFMESTSIEYKLKRNCDLQKVGGELDSKDYGIAMPANSPYRSHINRAILKLKEENMLDNIKKIWWEEKFGAKNKTCEVPSDEQEGDLEMAHLVGAFIVLIVGVVFGILITAAEFMNEVRNIVVREQVTHKEAFHKELRASLNFTQLQKPVLRNPSRAPSIALSEKGQMDKKEMRAAALQNFMDFEKGAM